MQIAVDTQQSKTSSNEGVSRAMELLSSIKKQRELFSQTLSTAQMPSELKLDSERKPNVPVEESPRQPLSPRNRKSGMNDAGIFVSSLRTKREDLIKRFEESNTPRSQYKSVPPSLLDPLRSRSSTSDSLEFGSDEENEMTIKGKRNTLSQVSPQKEAATTESKVPGFSQSLSTVRNSLKKVSCPEEAYRTKEKQKSNANIPWIKDDKELVFSIKNPTEATAKKEEESTDLKGALKGKNLPFFKTALAKGNNTDEAKVFKDSVNNCFTGKGWIKEELSLTDLRTNRSTPTGGLGGLKATSADNDKTSDSSSIKSREETAKVWIKPKEPIGWNLEKSLKRTAVLDSKSWIKTDDSAAPTIILKNSKLVGPPDLSTQSACAGSDGNAVNRDIRESLPEVSKKKIIDTSWIKRDLSSGELSESDNITAAKGEKEKIERTKSIGASPTERSFYNVELKKVDRSRSKPKYKGSSRRETSSAPRGRNRVIGRGDRSSVNPKPRDRQGKLPLPNKLVFERKVVPSPFTRPVFPQELSANLSGIKNARLYWKQNEKKDACGSAGREQPINGTLPKERQKSDKLASIIDSMERFSRGEFPNLPDQENRLVANESLSTDMLESGQDNISNKKASIDDGKANMKRMDAKDGKRDHDEGSTSTYYSGIECYFHDDDESESSIYQVDSYQDHFAIETPLQTSWSEQMLHEEYYDNPSQEYEMKIVSVLSSGDGQNPTGVNHATEIPVIEIDGMFVSRVRYRVARHSLLSSSPPRRIDEQRKHEQMNREGDPVFQVCDDAENKPMRVFKSLLQSAKGGDFDGFGSHNSNKPTKSMFKILKESLGQSSAKKESTDAITEDHCDNTTISSITRSVTSSHPQKTADTKQHAPLAVLNGIFKAAKKLQKKRKTKTGHSRRLSKEKRLPPMDEVDAARFDESHSVTSRMTSNYKDEELTSMKKRECGMYGNSPPKYVQGPTTSTVDAVSPAIQNLASL